MTLRVSDGRPDGVTRIASDDNSNSASDCSCQQIYRGLDVAADDQSQQWWQQQEQAGRVVCGRALATLRPVG